MRCYFSVLLTFFVLTADASSPVDYDELASYSQTQDISLQHERIVAVHPGTELLHVINYLSGIAKPMVGAYAYRDAVDSWFSDFSEHPAVLHAKGLPYNDFVELGWAFDDATMKLHMPEGFGWQGFLRTPEFLSAYLRLS